MDFFDHEKEDQDYELNAQYDYIREANAGMFDGEIDDYEPEAPCLLGHGNWVSGCACMPEELPF